MGEKDPEVSTSKPKQLVRSLAVCDDDDTKLRVTVLEKQSSSKSSGVSLSTLSWGSSNEVYRDPDSGILLEQFIISTLHKNRRDSQFLLDLEQKILHFLRDNTQNVCLFEPMSSYNRMLVHRVAGFFGLDHNVDQSGHAVVLTKAKGFRIPEVRFEDYKKTEIFTDDTLKRHHQRSYDQPQTLSMGTRKVRSFEERQEHYDYVRTRIFNQESSSSADGFRDSPSRSLSCSDVVSDSGYQFTGPYRFQSARPLPETGPTFYPSKFDAPNAFGPATYSSYDPACIAQSPMFDLQQNNQYLPAVPAFMCLPGLAQAPPGLVTINSITGQPLLNPDGSLLYREDSLLPAASVADPSLVPITSSGFVPVDPNTMADQFQGMSLVDAPRPPYTCLPPPIVPDPATNCVPLQTGTVYYVVPWNLPPGQGFLMQQQQQSSFDGPYEMLPQTAANTIPQLADSYATSRAVQYPNFAPHFYCLPKDQGPVVQSAQCSSIASVPNSTSPCAASISQSVPDSTVYLVNAASFSDG